MNADIFMFFLLHHVVGQWLFRSLSHNSAYISWITCSTFLLDNCFQHVENKVINVILKMVVGKKVKLMLKTLIFRKMKRHPSFPLLETWWNIEQLASLFYCQNMKKSFEKVTSFENRIIMGKSRRSFLSRLKIDLFWQSRKILFQHELVQTHSYKL